LFSKLHPVALAEQQQQQKEIQKLKIKRNLLLSTLNNNEEFFLELNRCAKKE
jgi:hypothetical protein